jgi:hypothetical protein
LDLQKKFKGQDYLKNDKGKYILDDVGNLLFFEEESNNLILYVKRLYEDFYLAYLDPVDKGNSFSPDKTKYVEIRMAKDDSSKSCCGIC